jgi:cell division septation protein DedD
MSEPGFREIQLNTKQVVFLFIAGVAGAVAIFLLGVTVGRGVTSDRPADAVQNTDPAADVKAGGVMPPATSPKPNELTYHDDLQGRGRTSAPPTPPDAPPETTPTRTPTPPPAAASKPNPTPAVSPAPQAAAAAKTSGGYFVQVDSFGSRANANRRVAELKGKGFVAFIFEAPGTGAIFNVRVGPFPDVPAAEAMRERLRKEGFRPSITR